MCYKVRSFSYIALVNIILYVIQLSISMSLHRKKNLLNWFTLDLYQKEISFVPKICQKSVKLWRVVHVAIVTHSRSL